MTVASWPGPVSGPVRTMFLGSGTFALPILDVLVHEPRVELMAVVTAPDRPAGRGAALTPTPVARRARALGLRLLQPERVRDAAVVEAIAALGPQLGILADFGQIVPRAVLDLPAYGFLNVHPSVLPRHRGATPIQAAIEGGDVSAGVSIILMDEGIDTGKLVAQQEWQLAGHERAPDLEAETAREGASLLRRTLGPWLEGIPLALPQPETPTPITRPMRREDARLDPARPAADLERSVRAHIPWPGSFLETSAGRLLVHEASTAPSAPGDEPGRLVRDDDHLALTTRQGRLILEVVQLGGKRAMAGSELLRGRESLVGSSVLAPEPTAGPAR